VTVVFTAARIPRQGPTGMLHSGAGAYRALVLVQPMPTLTDLALGW
jgi:hypothetical protein